MENHTNHRKREAPTKKLTAGRKYPIYNCVFLLIWVDSKNLTHQAEFEDNANLIQFIKQTKEIHDSEWLGALLLSLYPQFDPW